MISEDLLIRSGDPFSRYWPDFGIESNSPVCEILEPCTQQTITVSLNLDSYTMTFMSYPLVVTIVVQYNELNNLIERQLFARKACSDFSQNYDEYVYKKSCQLNCDLCHLGTVGFCLCG